MEAHPQPATHHVLDTPELLEMILAQPDLDMRTLLTSAQRVCRTWANLIRTSPTIQRALFFAPSRGSDRGLNDKEKILNPLLAETFHSIFQQPSDKDEHPQLKFSDLAMTKDAGAMARFVRKDASWRRMLVTQPPLFDIAVFNVRSSRGGRSAEISSIPADKESGLEGLRMRTLFDSLLFSSRIRFHGVTTIRVFWDLGNARNSRMTKQQGLQSRKIQKRFDQVLREFGLVIYTSKVVQCCPQRNSRLGAEELVKGRIVKAYEEQGFDVEFLEKVIELNRKDIGLLRAHR
ncbi:hypothetical protein BJX99DRAFT_230251 [Aspergillus californicus]